MWSIIAITALSGILAQIIHPIVVILYWTIGFQRYIVTDRSKQNQLLAKLKVKHSTSLKDDEKSFGLDSSYIRPGRVDKCWEFTHDMIVNHKKEK